MRRLKKVTKGGRREKVYDIGINNDIHAFIANGFIVHNCYDSTSYALSLMRETGAFIIDPKRPNPTLSVNWKDEALKADSQAVTYDLSNLGKALSRKEGRDWRYT